jgi:hypothetical protein
VALKKKKFNKNSIDSTLLPFTATTHTERRRRSIFDCVTNTQLNVEAHTMCELVA